MNRAERDDLLAAAAETFPESDWRGLRQACARLDARLGDGRWRLRLGARAGWGRPELEFVPAAAWAPEAERELPPEAGTRRCAGPAEGSFWLVLSWDAVSARFHPSRLGGLVRRPWPSVRFASPELAARAASLARRCPLSESWSEPDAAAGEWALRLERPEPWPRFLRLDMAAPFAEEASRHGLLLLGRRVEELGYRGDEMRVAVG